MMFIYIFLISTLCLSNNHSYTSAPAQKKELEIHLSFSIDYSRPFSITDLSVKQEVKTNALRTTNPEDPSYKLGICYPMLYQYTQIQTKTILPDKPPYWRELSLLQRASIHPLFGLLPQWMPGDRLATMNDANSFPAFLKNRALDAPKTAEDIAHFSKKTRLPVLINTHEEQHLFILTWRQPRLQMK